MKHPLDSLFRLHALSFPSFPPLPARRLLLIQTLSALLLPSSFAAVTRPRFIAVRVWPSAEYTRVTLEVTQPLEYETRLLVDPLRLVVDLKNAQLDAILQRIGEKIPSYDPYIAGVRIGQFTPEIVRIVFDLKELVKPQLFTLDPVATYQHRLVIDLYPQTPRDPIEQLLAQLQQTLPPSSPSSSPPTSSSSTPSSPPAASPSPVTPQPPQSSLSDSPSPPSSSAGTAASSPQPSAPASSSPLISSPNNRPASPEASPSSSASTAQRSGKPYVIVLDPGHGGEDPGAIGRLGTREKEVVLAVAQRVQKRLNADARTRAVLTRDGDYFISLAERVRRARRVRADLFISIHADAYIRPDVRGSSVYILNERGASSTAARWLADQENRSDLIGGVKLAGHSSAVAETLLDLSLTAVRANAVNLARHLLTEVAHVSRPHRPEVETANFAVLRNPDVPSVLLELAFITNPHEEIRLADPAYQEALAQAIYRGIKRYLERHAPRPRALIASDSPSFFPFLS
ncbi:MAG: N-acetylmuramoyl-L-alanine amidase [Hydrogenophilus sp.]|nr:N-acetylmuramoyl-L-alanine amidase [Hydrogenophilus sp.]